jgi:hypothetical protein
MCNSQLLPKNLNYATFCILTELQNTIAAFCTHILGLHKGIRFAGIANKDGKMMGMPIV